MRAQKERCAFRFMRRKKDCFAGRSRRVSKLEIRIRTMVQHKWKSQLVRTAGYGGLATEQNRKEEHVIKQMGETAEMKTNYRKTIYLFLLFLLGGGLGAVTFATFGNLD